MATFSVSGAISGLDTSQLLQVLLAAEKAPLTRLQTQRKTLGTMQSAYGDLRTSLARFETALSAFTKDLSGARRAASSSATSILTASAGNDALPSSYAVTVEALATSTRATSTASIGRAISGADLGATLSSLSLPGTVTGGQVSMVVDGVVVSATIGTPSTTTLGEALTAIGNALTSRIQANEGGGSTTTATVSIVANRLQVATSGGTHAVSFGVSGDTSNALAVLGLSGTGTSTLTSTTPITGRSALGVTRTSTVLDSAGLAATFPAASTGTLTLNGVAIAYDTSVDTLASIVTRINASTAGVTASLDRANDKLVLTAKTGGASYMGISDSGPLAAALNLAPGTVNAQTVGQQARVTVDGQTHLSDTNKITSAITGVTISALALGTSTVTVTPDTTAVTTAVQELVNAYNALADKLDSLTANKANGPRGALATDLDARSLALGLRRSLMTTGGAGAFTSLSQLGITSGAVGSAAGSTSRLSLDATKLAAAVERDPSAVANLLNGSTGLLASAATTVNNWTKSGGKLSSAVDSITSQLSLLGRREVDLQQRIDVKTAALEARFARMEQTLSEMQSMQNSLTRITTTSNNNSG